MESGLRQMSHERIETSRRLNRQNLERLRAQRAVKPVEPATRYARPASGEGEPMSAPLIDLTTDSPQSV